MIEIRIPESAFALGGPLEGADPKSARVSLPLIDPSGSIYLFLNVDVNGVTLDDIDFDSANYAQKRLICDLVTKGVIVVMHNGVVLTVTQIRDFTA